MVLQKKFPKGLCARIKAHRAFIADRGYTPGPYAETHVSFDVRSKRYCLWIVCPHCGEVHFHGIASPHATQAEVIDSLGHRETHCGGLLPKGARFQGGADEPTQVERDSRRNGYYLIPGPDWNAEWHRAHSAGKSVLACSSSR